LRRRLGGPQRWSGRCREENILDALLGNGYLNTFPSVKLSTRIDVRCWTMGLLPRYYMRIRHNAYMKSSNGNLGGGDLY
jgi:hypothetical protein